MGSGFSMAGGRSNRTYSGAGCLKLGCGRAVSAPTRSRNFSMRISSATSYSTKTENDPRSGAMPVLLRSPGWSGKVRGVFDINGADIGQYCRLLQRHYNRGRAKVPTNRFHQVVVVASGHLFIGGMAVLLDEESPEGIE